MSSYVNCLGGRCPHMPFFIGGHMSGGENVLHSVYIATEAKLLYPNFKKFRGHIPLACPSIHPYLINYKAYNL